MKKCGVNIAYIYIYTYIHIEREREREAYSFGTTWGTIHKFYLCVQTVPIRMSSIKPWIISVWVLLKNNSSSWNDLKLTWSVITSSFIIYIILNLSCSEEELNWGENQTDHSQSHILSLDNKEHNDRGHDLGLRTLLMFSCIIPKVWAH